MLCVTFSVCHIVCVLHFLFVTLSVVYIVLHPLLIVDHMTAVLVNIYIMKLIGFSIYLIHCRGLVRVVEESD